LPANNWTSVDISIDNKKIGVNMLRHIYLSTKYQPLATMNKELENDFKQMGSSTAQTSVYIKKT
jgi:hypothetical protein